MSDRDDRYPPDDIVLRNRLDIRDAPTLEAAERQLVAQRLLEPVPVGDVDLAHLKAIHHHLFQDVYAWAGDVRTVEIAKGKSQFQPRRFIAAGVADGHIRRCSGAPRRRRVAFACGPRSGIIGRDDPHIRDLTDDRCAARAPPGRPS